MFRPLYATVAVLALALAPSQRDASAQLRPKTKRAPPLLHRSNLPPERTPTPHYEEQAAASQPAPARASGLETLLPDWLRGWHSALAGHMPSELAWTVLAASPVALLALAVALALRARRRRLAPARPPEAAVTPRPTEPEPARRPHQRGDRTAPAVILDLSKEQEALLACSGQSASIYDCFLGLGPDLEALRCFRGVVGGALDAAGWASVVTGGRAERLRELGLTWTREVAIARLKAWLDQHPLVGQQGLAVQTPASLEEGVLESMTFTQPDGLGVSLSEEQRQLLYQARRALGRLAEAPERPLQIMAAAGQTRMLCLLPAHLADAGAGAGARAQAPFALALALRGLPALDWAIAVGLSPKELGGDLRGHLREHGKLVGTPVPAEGSAVHAALHLRGGPELAGGALGLLLAAVAGAAYSPGNVVLRASKRAAEVPEAARSALEQLGALTSSALADPGSPDAELLAGNARAMLGEELLAAEAKRAAAAAREVERWTSKDPLWRGGEGAARAPDLALAQLHHARVKAALAEAAAARERLFAILEKLAHAGQGERERALGALRLGFVMSALGMLFLRGAGAELLAAGREAQAALAPAIDRA